MDIRRGNQYLTSPVMISDTDPRLRLEATGSGANAKVWELEATGNTLLLKTLTDAYGAGATALTITRSGTAISSLNFAGPVGIGGTPTVGLLDVFGTGTQSARFRFTGATGGFLDFYDSTNSARRGYMGSGATTVGGLTVSDFAYASDAKLILATAGNVALTIDTSQRSIFGSYAGTVGANVSIRATSTSGLDIETADQNPFAFRLQNRTYSTNIANAFKFYQNNAGTLSISNMGSELLNLNATQTLHADGSAGAPSVSFINGTNGGWYRAAANDYRFALSGADFLRVVATSQFQLADDSATFIIGNSTASPNLVRDSGEILALKRGTAAQEFRTYTTTTGPKYISILGGTGIVPFGEDNTDTLGSATYRWSSIYAGTSLNVGLATNKQGDIYGGSNSALNLYLDTANSTASNDSSLIFRRSRGTQASRSDNSSGDYLGQIGFNIFSGGTEFGTAEIRGVVDGTFTSGQRPPSRIELYTNAANGAQTNYWTIKSNGTLTNSTASGLTAGAGKFAIDSSGNITKLNNVTYSFPASQGAVNQLLANDGSGNLSWVDEGGGGISPYLATQFDKTNATFANVTGLSVTLTAGRAYSFTMTLHILADAVSGWKLDFNGGSATATTFIAMVTLAGTSSAATISVYRATVLTDTYSGSGGGIANYEVHVCGVFIANAGGTFIPRFAQLSALGGTSSILVGSTLVVDDVT